MCDDGSEISFNSTKVRGSFNEILRKQSLFIRTTFSELGSHFFCTVRAVTVQARGGARDIICLKTAPIIGLFFFQKTKMTCVLSGGTDEVCTQYNIQLNHYQLLYNMLILKLKAHGIFNNIHSNLHIVERAFEEGLACPFNKGNNSARKPSAVCKLTVTRISLIG